jgi:hypothetical protein
VQLRGEGEYRNLNNFVHRIEHSSAIMHIASLQITNITELGRLSRVAFEMTLQLYYNRDDRLEWQPRMYMADAMGNIGHNPFFPLIHPVPPNTRNLTDVDQSRLVGITSQFILLRDQGGNLEAALRRGRGVSRNLAAHRHGTAGGHIPSEQRGYI